MTALLARWTEKLASGPQAGTSDSPPLARVMGVGRQQHYYDDDSDTLIMDLSDICDKLDDSEEENESLLE